MSTPANGDETTRTGLPGAGASGIDGSDGVQPGTWVGRAKPPSPPTLPPPVDPYWPPMDGAYYEPATGQAPYALVRPRRTRRATFMIVVGVLAGVCAVGSLLLLLGTALTKNAAATGAGRTTSAPAPTTKPAPPAPPGLNDPVRDGRFEFVITSVDCGQKRVGSGFLKLDAKGQFCVVGFTVRNISTEAQGFSEVFQRAVDDDGAEHLADTGAGLVVNGEIRSLWSNIQPGNSITGKMVFDIPKRARLVKIELHDSVLSGGTTVTL